MNYFKINKLFDVIRNGANIKQASDNSGIPITRIETIVDNKFNYSRVGYADIFDDRFKEYYLKNGDILMSHINSISHLGKVGLVENIDSNVIHGMNLLLLKAKLNFAFPKYLYYYFTTADFKIKLISITKKSVNQASFNIKDLKQIEIPLPSYKEQIKIANLLEKIENLLAESQNAIDLLDELSKATFYQMFGDPLKKENQLIKLKDLTTKIGSGSTPKGGNENYKDEGINLIRSLNVYNNEFSYKNLAFIDDNQAYYLRNVAVEKEDVLLNITGASVARCCIVPENVLPARVNQHVSILRFDRNLINPIYAVYLLTSTSFQSFLYNLSESKSATREALTKDQLENIKIFVPSINLQNHFATIAQKIEAIKTEKEEQKKVMEELYSSISKMAFTGELDLSKVHFDAALLPKESEVKEVDKIIKEKPKEEKLVKPRKTKEKGKPIVLIAKNWNQLSFKEIAEAIKAHFQEFYFNSEMLMRCLIEDLEINIDYFSSAEQKKNLQLENANDFLQFVSGALTGANPFLNLQQVFYNAETENIPDISFKEQDLEILTQKPTRERSGIYFKIRHETTTG
jgi:type I restriction enzyme S subunit